MRDATNKILEMVEEGILNPTAVLRSCLIYMSEYDVADMAECEGYISAEDDEDDEDDDYPDYDELEYQEADLIPRKASSALCIYMQTH